jgi:predicted nuclease of predicted toxin-antitoxin system
LKLLFDQNLSPQLAKNLQDLFPGSKHVMQLQSDLAGDIQVAHLAVSEDFTIVTQDDDFPELAYQLDPAPKVVWLTMGNSSTAHRERRLRAYHEQLEAFGADPERKLFILP